jgi:hypothetical protein
MLRSKKSGPGIPPEARPIRRGVRPPAAISIYCHDVRRCRTSPRPLILRCGAARQCLGALDVRHWACEVGNDQRASLGDDLSATTKGSDEKTVRKLDRGKMSDLRRQRIPSSKAARAAGPQDISAALQGMRWLGTNTKGGQLTVMSALVLITDSSRTSRHVRKVPKRRHAKIQR